MGVKRVFFFFKVMFPKGSVLIAILWLRSWEKRIRKVLHKNIARKTAGYRVCFQYTPEKKFPRISEQTIALDTTLMIER